MNKITLHPNPVRLVSTLAITVAGAIASFATPYATCLTNDGGVISFRLNQTNAQVQVIYNGGAAVTNLGPLPQGLTVTNLGISGTFKVKVTGSAAPGYVQISDDTATINRFANARGLAVNKRPGSPYFGRVYVANNGGGTAGTRPTTQGIYLLNSDGTDAVGQGDTGLTGGYNTGGLFPWKISVGQDDNIYGAGRDTLLAGVFVADPNITAMTNALFGTTSVYPMLTNFHGSINGVWVEGSQAGGDLKMYVNDEDYEELSPQRNSLWRYDIGATPFPYHPDSNNVPITHIFTPQLNAGNQAFNDVVRGGVSNYFYVMQVAASGFQPGIYVVDSSGLELTNSLSTTTNLTGNTAHVDIMKTSQALDISWDGKYLIDLRGLVSSVAQPAELITLTPDGLLDLTITNKLWLGLQSTSSSQSGAANRDVSFDAAGNLYNVSSSSSLLALRIWARGGYTIATTGSDGSYTLEEPPIITATTLINGGTQVQIDFTGPITAAAWYYKLQSSGTINGTYTDTADTVTRLSSGVFRVITSVTPGANQFFKIHQP